MSTDLADLTARLDPVRYLPTPAALNGTVPRDAFRLAEQILAAAREDPAYCGARRSALAGGALYAAAVALHGPVVTQDAVAEATGTTCVSLRGRMADMARVAIESGAVDVSEFAATGDVEGVLRRLRHLAGGGRVPELPAFEE